MLFGLYKGEKKNEKKKLLLGFEPSTMPLEISKGYDWRV